MKWSQRLLALLELWERKVLGSLLELGARVGQKSSQTFQGARVKDQKIVVRSGDILSQTIDNDERFRPASTRNHWSGRGKLIVCATLWALRSLYFCCKRAEKKQTAQKIGFETDVSREARLWCCHPSAKIFGHQVAWTRTRELGQNSTELLEDIFFTLCFDHRICPTELVSIWFRIQLSREKSLLSGVKEERECIPTQLFPTWRENKCGPIFALEFLAAVAGIDLSIW